MKYKVREHHGKFKGVVKDKDSGKLLFAAEPFGIQDRVSGIIQLREPIIR